VIGAILDAIDSVQKQFPNSPPLYLGDFSAPTGGSMRNHSSHQNGRDVDIGMYAKGNRTLDMFAPMNEENLDVEWHDKRGLSAALYMDMLKRSHAAIKAKCPGIAVISGAPTPNGLNNGTAIDDVAWMHQLYQNGLKDYSDGIGAHPSGFRTSPLTAWTGASLGSYADHRSFLFRGTMDSYRAVMVQHGDANILVWPTEFGWASESNPVPGYEYARDNTPDEQARFLVQAYQMAKGWGWVGPMFLWNLNFGITNPGTELAAFGIANRPAYAALANMPK
jgi:hypothetical protein